MNVITVESTDNPEQTTCKAARGDYMDAYYADMAYSEIMASVDYDDDDRAFATDELGAVDEDTIENMAKTRSMVTGLLDKGHFGPFEHPNITFAVNDISRICMAQATRHRIGTSFDVQSLRYTTPSKGALIEYDTIDNYIIIPDRIEHSDEEFVLRKRSVDAFRDYQAMLQSGIPPEYARFVLPMATGVNMTVTFNARSLMHFLDMRGKGDAQDEIIQLAHMMLDEAKEWMPASFEYYDNEMLPRRNQLSP